MAITNVIKFLKNKNAMTPHSIIAFYISFFAWGQGVEPRLTGPEPAVLPLDDPQMRISTKTFKHLNKLCNRKFSSRIKISGFSFVFYQNLYSKTCLNV